MTPQENGFLGRINLTAVSDLIAAGVVESNLE
jgi:hypothetical protein